MPYKVLFPYQYLNSRLAGDFRSIYMVESLFKKVLQSTRGNHLVMETPF